MFLEFAFEGFLYFDFVAFPFASLYPAWVFGARLIFQYFPIMNELT